MSRIICMGGRTAVAEDLVDGFPAARFNQAQRHLRRLNKVAALEANYIHNGQARR